MRPVWGRRASLQSLLDPPTPHLLGHVLGRRSHLAGTRARRLQASDIHSTRNIRGSSKSAPRRCRPGPRNKVHNCSVTPNIYIEVHAYSKSWPCLFPQHGPGIKHTKTIPHRVAAGPLARTRPTAAPRPDPFRRLPLRTTPAATAGACPATSSPTSPTTSKDLLLGTATAWISTGPLVSDRHSAVSSTSRARTTWRGWTSSWGRSAERWRRSPRRSRARAPAGGRGPCRRRCAGGSRGSRGRWRDRLAGGSGGRCRRAGRSPAGAAFRSSAVRSPDAVTACSWRAMPARSWERS